MCLKKVRLFHLVVVPATVRGVVCAMLRLNSLLLFTVVFQALAKGPPVVDREGFHIPAEYIAVRRILDGDTGSNTIVPCNEAIVGPGGCTDQISAIPTFNPATGAVTNKPSYGSADTYSGAVGVVDYALTDPMVAPPTDGSPYGMHVTPESNTDFIFSWQAGAASVGDYFINTPLNLTTDPKCTTMMPNIKLGTSSGMYSLKFQAQCVRFVRDYSRNTPAACNLTHGATTSCYNYLSPYLLHARVTGLAAGQTYYYVVGDSAFTSAEKTFSTLPASPYPFVMVAMADLGQVTPACASRPRFRVFRCRFRAFRRVFPSCTIARGPGYALAHRPCRHRPTLCHRRRLRRPPPPPHPARPPRPLTHRGRAAAADGELDGHAQRHPGPGRRPGPQRRHPHGGLLLRRRLLGQPPRRRPRRGRRRRRRAALGHLRPAHGAAPLPLSPHPRGGQPRDGGRRRVLHQRQRRQLALRQLRRRRHAAGQPAVYRAHLADGGLRPAQPVLPGGPPPLPPPRRFSVKPRDDLNACFQASPPRVVRVWTRHNLSASLYPSGIRRDLSGAPGDEGMSARRWQTVLCSEDRGFQSDALRFQNRRMKGRTCGTGRLKKKRLLLL